jgi:hypothetical protein
MDVPSISFQSNTKGSQGKRSQKEVLKSPSTESEQKQKKDKSKKTRASEVIASAARGALDATRNESFKKTVFDLLKVDDSEAAENKIRTTLRRQAYEAKIEELKRSAKEAKKK